MMWHKYLPDIRERAQVLEDAARSASAGKLSQSEREAAKSAAHKLAGTLGTFGLHRGTDLARELEHIYADAASTVPAAQLTAIAAEIQSIIESRK
jgi:HPt (histidine-containing phosphotransfer) domain-containing protein